MYKIYILDVTFFSSEVWFHLSRYIHSCMWLAVNLHNIMHTPLHDQKVGVWCMMSQSPIFKDSVKSGCCCELILYPFICTVNDRQHCSWRPAGWCYSVSITLVHNVFSEQLISRTFVHRSSDLSDPDFCLWGKMKTPLYRDSPCSLHHLNKVITNFISNMRHAELVHVFVTKMTVGICLSESIWTHFQLML